MHGRKRRGDLCMVGPGVNPPEEVPPAFLQSHQFDNGLVARCNPILKTTAMLPFQLAQVFLFGRDYKVTGTLSDGANNLARRGPVVISSVIRR
jgi:hypothetical protein